MRLKKWWRFVWLVCTFFSKYFHRLKADCASDSSVTLIWLQQKCRLWLSLNIEALTLDCRDTKAMFFWYFRFNTSISFSAWAVPRSFNSCNPWHKPTLDMIAHVIVNRTELGPTEIKILSICQTCFFPEKTNESQNSDANSIVRIWIDIMTSIPNIHNKLCHPCAKIKDQICSKEILGPCCITSRCSAMMLEFFWASLFQVCNSSWSSSSSWTVTRMHQYDWKGVLLSTKVCQKCFIHFHSTSWKLSDDTASCFCSQKSCCLRVRTHDWRDTKVMFFWYFRFSTSNSSSAWLRGWINSVVAIMAQCNAKGRSENSGWSHPSTQRHYNLWPQFGSIWNNLVLKCIQTHSPSSKLIQTPSWFCDLACSCSSLRFSGRSCSSSFLRLLFRLLQLQSTLVKLL